MTTIYDKNYMHLQASTGLNEENAYIALADATDHSPFINGDFQFSLTYLITHDITGH